MSAPTNETLVRSLFNAFNTRKFDEGTKLVTDKFVWRDVASGQTFTGPAGVRKFMEAWATAFNDGKAEIKRMISTDKAVVTEYIGRGTHTGTLHTPNGDIPATNQKCEVPFVDICTIDNGKLTALNTYYDAATMMHQLGLLEPVGAHK
jgi:steroid delta-isomerase-like uncharacterized protein